MPRVALQYGHGEVEFSIPDGRLLGELRPAAPKQISDPYAESLRALASPLGSPPLGELCQAASTALVLTVDFTRPSPRPLLEPLLDELASHGIKADIAIAAGRHRPMTDAELHAHLGERIVSCHRIILHNSFDAAAHIELGVTSRGTPIRVNRCIFDYDLVLAVGSIEPTYMPGFSGGRKMLLPGMAWHESVDANHYLITQPGTGAGILAGNPMSEDMEEFARELPLHFILYGVIGPEDEIAAIVAGDRHVAHREGCRLSGGIFRVRSPRAGIVISSVGGHPYDCDLVQGKKAIIPASALVEDGGAIIIVAEAPERWGAEAVFSEWLLRYSPEEVIRRASDRAQFSLGAHGARILAKPIVEQGVRVIVLTNPGLAEDLDGSFVDATAEPEQALRWAMEHAGDAATVLAVHKARRLIAEPAP